MKDSELHKLIEEHERILLGIGQLRWHGDDILSILRVATVMQRDADAKIVEETPFETDISFERREMAQKIREG